jgi:hypothetical protein
MMILKELINLGQKEMISIMVFMNLFFFLVFAYVLHIKIKTDNLKKKVEKMINTHNNTIGATIEQTQTILMKVKTILMKIQYQSYMKINNETVINEMKNEILYELSEHYNEYFEELNEYLKHYQSNAIRQIIQYLGRKEIESDENSTDSSGSNNENPLKKTEYDIENQIPESPLNTNKTKTE